MTKCIRDGKVAILYSPNYGAGWSTWNGEELKEFLLHDEKLVELVETDQRDKIEDYVKSVFPDEERMRELFWYYLNYGNTNTYYA